ncbi:MAG: hypothetical protein KDJ36_07200 [Hyphomicrobiaceae bacterium]|nr:hypothetical protein [Hyphomicrobiaceae bacterium]
MRGLADRRPSYSRLLAARPRSGRSGPSTLAALACLAFALALPTDLAADDTWNPFAERDAAARKRAKPQPPASDRPYLPPMPGSPGRWRPGPGAAAPPGQGYGNEPPPTSASPPPTYGNAPGQYGAPPPAGAGSAPAAVPRVQRGDLAPVTTGNGTGLGAESWQGVDVATVEQLVAPLKVPNRSLTLDKLWRSLLTGPAAAGEDPRFAAIRAEALYQSGRLEAAAAALKPAASRTASKDAALITALSARIDLARRNTATGCQAAKHATQARANLPRALRGEIIAMAGYCAIISGSKDAGPLSAGLARREGYNDPFVLALLEIIGRPTQSEPSYPERIEPLGGLLLEQARLIWRPEIVSRATPPLLAMLSGNGMRDTAFRLTAAEEAASRNVISDEDLAAAYKAHPFKPEELADPFTPGIAPAVRRALLYQVAHRNRTPLQRTRVIRALVDDARRHELTLPILRLIKPLVDDLPRAPEIGWFAETAIEAQLAAGDHAAANAWTIFAAALDQNASGTMEHWRTLIAISEPAGPRSQPANLSSLESLAVRGRFTPEMLHRLATVLDALDYNIPIPLWEAASKSPQPRTGYLPPTGVLSQLQDAAKRKQTARLILLAMRALGSDGATSAHMIALGDTIRALKRGGFEAEARRIAFEAVFESWPRTQAP